MSVNELSELKVEYGNRCTVLQQGEFTNVTVRLSTLGCSLKFQLSKLYPDEAPQVIVRGESITQSQKDELLLHLKEIMINHPNDYVLKSLVKLADKWISEHNIVQVETKPKPKQQKYKEPKKRVKKVQEVLELEKKPRMKTADEVINRLLWDDGLPKQYFVVGYLDRFRGIVEKEFNAFSWEDISSVGIDVLAIPKHRIVYFKYKTLTVWHKTQRLDLIFGSTDNAQRSIHETLAQYEEKDSQSVIEEGAASLNLEDTDEETAALKKKRPTHFLSVRITNEAVLNKIADIHDIILKNEPGYLPCLAAPSKAHITLFVMGLDTPEQVADACRILRDSKEMLKKLNPDDLVLKFEGLDSFGWLVLFARVECNEVFTNMVADVKYSFEAAGISMRGNKGKYKPHLTIFKGVHEVQQDITRNIIPELMKDAKYGSAKFGYQRVEEISLCAMDEQKRDDGYYQTLASVSVID